MLWDGIALTCKNKTHAAAYLDGKRVREYALLFVIILLLFNYFASHTPVVCLLSHVVHCDQCGDMRCSSGLRVLSQHVHIPAVVILFLVFSQSVKCVVVV